MGQNESSFKRTYAETVSQLSSVQLQEISDRFDELYAKAGGAKGLVVDREAFSQHLNLPVTIGDRLFDAFDEKKNGSICFEEFVCGLAVVLHGSFKERCGLLFRVFNMGNDEGVSRAELRTMLTAILQSTNTILYTVGHTDKAVLGGEDMQQTITAMVDAAFANCDISRTGKLLPAEFEYWLKRNPKILDSLLSFKTRKDECTVGSLLMSPSEQQLSAATPKLSPQARRVSKGSPSANRSSQDSLKERERPQQQLGVKTEPMFKIGSEESLSSGNAAGRQDSVLSQQSVGMESSISSSITGPQGSLISDTQLHSVAIETGQYSLPTQQSGREDAVSQSKGELVINIEEEGNGGASFDGGERREGKEGGDVSGAQISLSMDLLEGEASEEMDGGAEPPTVSFLLEEQETAGADQLKPVEQVGLDLESAGETPEAVDTSKQTGLVPNVSIPINLEAAGSGSTSDPLTSGPLPPTDQQLGGAHSIMHADSALSISIAAVPQIRSKDQLGPDSPVLPTQQIEEVGGTEAGGGTFIVGGIEEEEEELCSLGGIAKPLGAESARQEGIVTEMGVKSEGDVEEGVAVTTENAGVADTKPLLMEADTFPQIQASPPQTQVPPPQPQQVELPSPSMPLPPVSVGRLSPLMWVETESSKVSERISQAWVLSEWTRSMLGNHQPGAHLTCPALMTDIKLEDELSSLLATHYPNQQRKPMLTVDQVPMDESGLRRLVSTGCLHSALELTARFLSAHGQGLGQAGQLTIHTHKTLQMWSARVALLMHLQLFKEAELELHAFGEMLNPDLYYQYHTQSYPGRKGSMVPFTMRLLHANLPRHVGKVHQAQDRLCTLQYICEQVLTSLAKGKLPEEEEMLPQTELDIAKAVWKDRLCRVKCCLANTLLFLQDYGVAAKLYREIAQGQPLVVKTELLSGIGRLYLQLGDLSTATSYFNQVKNALGDGAETSSLVKLNAGYLNVFLSRWQTAKDCFEDALALDPTSTVIQSNITVCTFYLGRLKDSITAMEQLVTSAPPRTLQPALFANLATSYELESGNSTIKKLGFLPLLAQHIGQGHQHLSHLNIR